MLNKLKFKEDIVEVIMEEMGITNNSLFKQRGRDYINSVLSNSELNLEENIKM